MPAVGKVAWAVLSWLLSIAAVAFIVFLVLDLLPGDAATQQLGMDATPEALAQLRAQYGLDQPALIRFGSWLGGLLHGDWGQVVATGKPVAGQLATALGRTGIVLLGAGLGIILAGIGGGILSGVRSGGRGDRTLSSAALAIICTPEFVLGTLLVLIFASWLRILPAVSLVPVGGTVLDKPSILVLPILAIALMGSAMLFRQTRAVVARMSEAPHVEAARLAGLTEPTVIRRHLLPGVIPPVLQASAAVVPYLLGGTVVVERIFAYPGLGSLLVSAVSNREPNLLMACVVVIVGASLAAYRLADAMPGIAVRSTT